MDCGFNHEATVTDIDPPLGSRDEVSGFLNHVVNQSICDLIEEDNSLRLKDKQFSQPDFENKDKESKVNYECTAADLRLDLSSTSDQKSGQSAVSIKETTDPLSSGKTEEGTDKDLDQNIDDFVSKSLMRIVGDDTTMVLMGDNEKEMHQDVRSEDHKLGTIDIVGEAKKEIVQFHTDKDSVQLSPTVHINEKKVNDIETKDRDLYETAVHDTKPSSRSAFGFFFNRRRSRGSIKLRFPCLQLVCGKTKVEDYGNFPDNRNTCCKKPGFLSRIFSCLRKGGSRVRPS